MLLVGSPDEVRGEMAKFRRLSVLNTIEEIGLIPLFYEGDADNAYCIIAACLDGGARAIEFTNRGDGAHLIFEQMVDRFRGDSRLILGAGSVIDAGAAALYLQLGANFIVGPTLNEEVAFLCNQHKVAYIPGCGSVNEISAAERLGAEICKIFPGSAVGGPAFIKSVLGPMPWSSLMPTGGVEPKEESLRAWFKAGVVCVGMGSKLIPKDDLREENYAAITTRTRQVIDWIREIRAEHNQEE